MTFFQHLPSSVLRAGAIFLSIIIEALPFVLIGSIISGDYWGLYHPGGLPLSSKNRIWADLLWDLYRLYLSFL